MFPESTTNSPTVLRKRLQSRAMWLLCSLKEDLFMVSSTILRAFSSNKRPYVKTFPLFGVWIDQSHYVRKMLNEYGWPAGNNQTFLSFLYFISMNKP